MEVEHHKPRRERSRTKTALIRDRKRRFRQRVIVLSCLASAILISLFWLTRDYNDIQARFEMVLVYVVGLMAVPGFLSLLLSRKKQEWHYIFLIAFAACLFVLLIDDVLSFSKNIREIQKTFDYKH